MDRLTSYNELGMVVSDHPTSEIMNRLAQYEDTGLTPEKMVEIDKMYLEKCKEVNQMAAGQGSVFADKWITHLDELAEEAPGYYKDYYYQLISEIKAEQERQGVASRWIPVSSGELPKENQKVYATLTNGKETMATQIVYWPNDFRNGVWELLAWMPLPPKYEPEGE